MILTCPNCYSQFKVSLAVIGNTGRNVRCSACGEVWFEDEHVVSYASNDVENPVDNNEVGDTHPLSEQEVMDIPDAIKPVNDEIDNSKNIGEGMEKKISYAIAAAVFLLVFVYLLLSSTSMMRAHPSMQSFYALFGIHMDLPDSGKVTFVNIKAVDHDDMIEVSGDIVNLTDNPQTLRMIEVVLSEGSDQILSQWYVVPPKLVLDAEETVTFNAKKHLEKHTDHEQAGHEVEPDSEAEHSETEHNAEIENETQYVQVRFVLSPALTPAKTDEEDDGNIPVPHASGNDHQNDHEASL